MSYDPHWLSVVLVAWEVAVAPVVLTWAAATSMLGLSRHVYALARNRQVPSWLGKLSGRATPYVAILVAGVMALALAIPTDVRLLAEIYAFGATLAIAIAHLSILRLRLREPNRERPYRIPFNVTFRNRELPIPALLGAVLMLLLWVAVLVFHARARWVGGGWMVFGLIAYVVYRKVVEGTTLTMRVSVPEQALRKEVQAAEYTSILVPVFGTKLDDDIVGTAGGYCGRAGGGASAPRRDLCDGPPADGAAGRTAAAQAGGGGGGGAPAREGGGGGVRLGGGRNVDDPRPDRGCGDRGGSAEARG